MDCEIRHSTVIAAAPEVVSAALSEPRQLAHWWTREVSLAGDLVRLYWSRQGWRVELSIDAGANHQLVCWRCHDSNMRDTDAWKGTVMRFELRPTSQGTQIDFVQSGYRDSPCKEACARGWRFFPGHQPQTLCGNRRGRALGRYGHVPSAGATPAQRALNAAAMSVGVVQRTGSIAGDSV